MREREIRDMISEEDRDIDGKRTSIKKGEVLIETKAATPEKGKRRTAVLQRNARLTAKKKIEKKEPSDEQSEPKHISGRGGRPRRRGIYTGEPRGLV